MFSLGILFTIAYAVWSYSLTDPNLVLTSWQPYWDLQQWLWKHIWQQPQLLTSIYEVLIFSLFGWYGYLLFFLNKNHSIKISNLFASWLVLILVFVFSQNALSHDIYNYLFNAKMVLQYHANPHIQTALQFPDDTWTRFMHNTHTPAPYGYGWTALSLLPASIGLQKFTITWLCFKFLNLVGAVLLGYVLIKLVQQVLHRQMSAYELSILFFNPLFLIEIFGNGHNDLWMMVPVLFSFSKLLEFIETKNAKLLLISIVSFGLSLSTKYATIAILPVWSLLLLSAYTPTNHRLWSMIRRVIMENWPALASFLLFLPLLTARSQQFHPWYLVWILVWLPLLKNKLWRAIILSFSLSSMLRYIPWLQAGGYSAEILGQQKMITWLLPSLCLIIWYWYGKKKTRST